MTRTPIPGHISSLRAAEEEQKKSSVKDASKKHIDPFTGESFMNINHLILHAIDFIAGTVQENGVSSTMGAPLMLTHNNHRSSHSLNNNLSDEHFDMLDTERDSTTVNGKIDINIKDNSIRDKTDNKAQYYSVNDLKRNYH